MTGKGEDALKNVYFALGKGLELPDLIIVAVPEGFYAG